MARTLITNVWANGEAYGPAHGRLTLPEGVGLDLPDDVFADDGIDHDLPPVPLTGERTAASGTEDPASPMVSTGAAAGSGDDGGGAQPPPEPDPEPSIDLDALDKPELLRLAEKRGVEVDGRWGAARLRRALRDAEGA